MGIASTAFAEDPAAPPPAADPAATPPPVAAATGTSAPASESKMRLSLNLVPMPFLGKFKTNFGGMDQSADAAFAFGVAPIFDYSLTSMFFVGASPMYTFNVKGKDSMGDAAKQFDVLLRVGATMPAADKVNVYGYLSPGYSWVIPPQGDSAKGFTFGVHAGAAFDLASNIFLNGQIGYQLGFQSVSGVDFKTNFLQIGLGGGIRL